MAVKVTVYGEAKLEQIQRAQAELNAMERSIRSNSAGIGASLDRIGSRLQSVGQNITKAGQSATRNFTVPILAAGVAVYKLTQSAADDEKQQKVLARQLQKNAHATDEAVAATERWITAQGNARGVADDKLRPALAVLAGATKDVQKSQELASLAMDVSAARGLDLETVSKALAKGYAGNTGALGKLVPGISKAALASHDFTRIQGELAKMVGGTAATAADTASGKWERMKLRIREAGESIGYAFLPMLTKVADFVSAKVAPALERFATWLGKLDPKILVIAGAAAAAVAAIGPLLLILGAVTSSIGTLIKLAPLIGRAFSTALGPIGIILGLLAAAVTFSPELRELFQGVLMKLVAKLSPVFAQLVTAIEPIIGLLGGALAKVAIALVPPLLKIVDAALPLIDVVLALVGPILALLDPILALLDPILALIAPLLSLVSPIIALIEPLLDLVMVILKPLIALLGDQLKQAVGYLQVALTALMPVIKWLVGLLSGVAEAAGMFIDLLTGKINFQQFMDGLMNLGGPLGDIIRWVVGVQTGIRNFVVDSIRNVIRFEKSVRDKIGEVIGFFVSIPTRLGEAMHSAATWLISTGTDIVKGIRKGIQDGWDGLVKWFNGLVDGLVKGVKDLLGIHSPSRVFADVGSMMGEGMRVGLLGSVDRIRNAALAAAAAATIASMSFVGVSASAASDGSFVSAQTGSASAPIGAGRSVVVYVQDGAVRVVVRGGDGSGGDDPETIQSGLQSALAQLFREVVSV
jgi:phage-related protein